MSLLFQQQNLGTASSEIGTNCKKSSPVNSMYKTEIDLGVVRPHTQHSFKLSHKDSISALSSEKPPAACVVSPADSAMDAAVSAMSGPGVDTDGSSEVKVETRPIGKISALITRFNDGEPGALDAKIPPKKFIIDLESVHKRYNNVGKTMGASSSGQADEVISIAGSETPRLPIVELNFKLNIKTASPKEDIVDTNISTKNKQLCALKIPPKPSPKPNITKTGGHQAGLMYSQNTQPMRADRSRPSEVHHQFPSVNNELPRRDNSGKVIWASQHENGRNKHVHTAISATQSSRNENNLIQAQNKETPARTVVMCKDINNGCDRHRKNDSLSKDHPQERDSIEEKQRKATVLKPAALARHGSINRHNQFGNNGKLVSDDLVLASIATVAMNNFTCSTVSRGTGGQQATSGESDSTFCPGRDVIITEKQEDFINNNDAEDVTHEEKGNVTVKDNMTDSPIYCGMGNITKFCESRNGNMEGNHSPIDCTTDRPGSSAPNVSFPSEKGSSIDGFTTSIELRVGSFTESIKSSSSECKTSIDSIVIECSTSRESSVATCPTSREPNVAACPTSRESTVALSPTSREPSVAACPTSRESSVAACPTSREPSVAACPTSREPSVALSPTSREPSVALSPTSRESSVAACPTSREPSVALSPTSKEPSVALSPTSREPSVALSPTSREPSVAACPTSREPSVALSPTSREPSLVRCPLKDHNDGSNAISAKLGMLKSELMAMRKMDLVLLRQLINISQAIQRIQRSDLPKVSRSLTILSSRRTPQSLHKPVERQNSAPHCADRRRFLFSNVRWKTDEDYRDSLSSFDESEFDSQSELEESSSSLNSNTTSGSRPFSCPRVLFQSCSIPLSLDVSEEAEESYEDILQRNVRLWKMSFQRHQSQQEKLDVWF